jgi:hypothetical protein
MRRLSRTLTVTAVGCLLGGVATLPLVQTVAIAGLVLGTGAVLGALFTWFRLEHLRELERLKQ